MRRSFCILAYRLSNLVAMNAIARQLHFRLFASGENDIAVENVTEFHDSLGDNGGAPFLLKINILLEGSFI